jgi:hypothetical protein
MTPDEYINNMEAFQAELEGTFLNFCISQGMNAKALIQHRIQESGNNADDEQLGIYTSESYAKKREKRGRQIFYVDLTFTRGGAGMFGSTGVIQQSFANGIARVSVGGRDEFTAEKLGYNSERYGDILRLNKKEEDLIDTEFSNYIEDLAKKNKII